MSDASGEETDNMELQPLVYENEDIARRPERETNGGIKSPRDDTVPPDSVDGTQNNGPVEIPEIFSPGVGDTFTVPLPILASNPRPRPGAERRQRRHPGMDETDYEGIKDPTTDHEDEQEPSNSGLHPSQTEGVVEASSGPDDATTARCFLSKSSYLQKKCNELFFAVCYNLKERMDEILNDEEPSTLVKLLTWPDTSTNGRPCIMKAVTRQSLNCIRPLLEHLKTLNFDLFGMNKMDALQSQCDGKNILHVAAQMVRLDQEIINAIDIDLIMNQLADNEDRNGTTPLIVACQYQNDFMAQRLVSVRARIDHVDHDGNSPIYLAAARGSDETLKLFLQDGALGTTNQQDLFKKRELYHDKGTILQAILESRSPKTLQVCLDIDNGRDVIMNCLRQELVSNQTFIHAVCETPLVSLVKLAIEDNEQVLESLDNDGVTPLMKATEAEQLDIVKLILSKDSGKKTLSWQKTSTKETALMITCKKGFHEIVKFIMENSDTDMNLDQKDQDDSNVFHHAAKHDNILCVMIEICTEKYKNYKDYLNLKDKDGYVPLHLAATSGSYKNVELLLDNGVPYDTLSSSSRTALHYAAFSKIETVKVLLEFVTNKIDKPDALKQFIDAVDSRRQTSLHIAASFGKWQTVSVLLDNGAAIKCDEENETALHLASFEGCTKTVKLLIRNKPAMVNHENRVGETAAMFAALNGQTEVLKILFDNKAKLWAESHGSSVEKRKTCLDWAVENNKPDTAKAILEHTNWKETMEKSCFAPDGLLAKMVKSMPNVAIDVLNKCEIKKEVNGVIIIEYDFFALQTRGEKPSGEKRIDNVTAMAALETMAENSRIECLNHAVVQKFVEKEWSRRAKKWYWGCLSIYAIFLLSFTTYISLFTQGYASDSRGMIISRIICYVFATLNVIRELLQLYHRKSQYFSIQSNYLDVVMYICVFIFLPYDKKSNMQLQAGAIAIFLGWINFTWFLKRFPTYGIYIIMTKKIFFTFIKVFVPVSFFIIAFSMTFFVLLHGQENVHRNCTARIPDERKGFGNVGLSFVTSFAMMVGEVDYHDVFIQQTGKNVVLIQLFLVLFLVLMSVLLMNLLTGLAVGDIEVIMKRSLAEKRIQRAMLIVDLHKHLNKYPCLEAEYLKPLTILTRSQERNGWVMSYAGKLIDKMCPPLDIEEEKSQECEIIRMKEQLNSIQNILEEMNKRSLSENQVGKNRELIRPRQNTLM